MSGSRPATVRPGRLRSPSTPPRNVPPGRTSIPPSPATRPPAATTPDSRTVGSAPAMDFELSDEQRLLRDTVRDFARAEVAPVAAELDRTKAFPYEIVARLGALGLMGIPFPSDYGGGGAD